MAEPTVDPEPNIINLGPPVVVSEAPLVIMPKATDSSIVSTDDDDFDDASEGSSESFGGDFEPSKYSAEELRSTLESAQRTLEDRKRRIFYKRLNMPESTILIFACTAALEKKILMQGRLFLTYDKLSFYSKIFGVVTEENFDLDKIKDITLNEKGIKNGFYLTEERGPNSERTLHFTSLINRTKFLGLLQCARRLKTLNQNRSSPPSTPSAITYPSVEIRSISPDRSARVVDLTPISVSSDALTPEALEIRSVSPPVEFSSMAPSGASPATDSPTPVAITTQTTATKDPIDKYITTEPDSGTIVHAEDLKEMDTFELPLTPVQFCKVFYFGTFEEKYHGERGDTDLTLGPWSPRPELAAGYFRDIGCTVPMTNKLAGCKFAKCSQLQRFHLTRDSLVSESWSQVFGANMSDYFKVEARWEITSTGPNTSHVRVLNGIHFVKSTMFKGPILNGAKSESKKSLDMWQRLAREHIAGLSPAALGTGSVTTTTTVVTPDIPVVKQTAPVPVRRITPAAVVTPATPLSAPVLATPAIIAKPVISKPEIIQKMPSFESFIAFPTDMHDAQQILFGILIGMIIMLVWSMVSNEAYLPIGAAAIGAFTCWFWNQHGLGGSRASSHSAP